MSSAPVADAVFRALAKQLNLPEAQLRARANDGLDALGLDSHGLMRVLLEIEQALGLPTGSLDLPDQALESPQTMVDGVAAARP